MASFDYAINLTKNAEGGYQNSLKGDVGNYHFYCKNKLIGTKFGISGNLYSLVKKDKNCTIVTESTMRNLTKKEAESVYKSVYWDKLRLTEIKSDEIAAQIFDWSIHVNTTKKVIQPLQEILNRKFKEKLATDGIIGSMTIAAVNRAIQKNAYLLGTELANRRIEYYQNSAQNKNYTDSFINRVNNIPIPDNYEGSVFVSNSETSEQAIPGSSPITKGIDVAETVVGSVATSNSNNKATIINTFVVVTIGVIGVYGLMKIRN